MEEGLKAIEFDNVATVQLIYNIFRQRPQEYFFQRAASKNVGIIVRVPLASGLLSGAFSKKTTFNAGDHRQGNRKGEWFDKGETFAGMPYEKGLTVVEKLKVIFPGMESLVPVALQWILRRSEVSCVIPGASRMEQVISNVHALDRLVLTEESIDQIHKIYEEDIKEWVHYNW